MIHLINQLSLSTPVLTEETLNSIILTASAVKGQDGFLINPWLGLIGLGVLVVSGAVAVIREIEIEEEDVRR